ncbi:cupin domain-containing protein [Nocardia grenadensis]|uniref:cupin domain-containing protein n=1 Tax=Nocardia grenadensis TaxID=931537 RepID=UPI003D73E3F0
MEATPQVRLVHPGRRTRPGAVSGIRLRSLRSGRDGASAHVLEMAPGRRWECVDVHRPGPEEVFVVSGTANDGVRDNPAGSFIHAPAGSWHISQPVTGCALFVF